MSRRAIRAVLAALAGLVASAVPAAAAPPPAADFGLSHHRVCGAQAPGFARCHADVVDAGATGPNAVTPTGLNPPTIKSVYGFPTSLGAGTGQTIAIVDAYDDPTIEKDLGAFSTQYSLPACTTANGCFKKVNQTGGAILPNANSGWALEISLDVEWAHAIAPAAQIVLVEATSNSFTNLLIAEDYAAAHAGYVSNSWGGSESSSEAGSDSHFTRSGVSYFVSAGDAGLPAEYPSSSPNVVSVGGTTLHFSGGNFTSETGWSGGGGGCSAYENASAAQSAFAGYAQAGCNGKRATPDVALDADPASGVAVYDTTTYQGTTGWFTVGGTSASSPMWAARSAVAGGVMNSSSVYGNGITFRDITSGNNGAACLVGFDLCSGRGSWSSSPGPSLPSTTTAVVSSLNPSSSGQSVTFTSTVSPSSGPTPTGTVQFRDGAGNLGSAQPVNGSAQAMLSTAALAAGPHSITAVYSGDGNYSGSTSPVLTQTVTAPVTPITTSVASPSNNATVSGTSTALFAGSSGPVTSLDYRLSGGPANYSSKLVGQASLTIYGWLYSWNTTSVPDGVYTLRSRAYDASLNFVDSAPVSITVDNISTSVGIPANNATVSGTGTTLDAAAKSSATITAVEFRISGGAFTKTLLGQATASPWGWLYSWNTTLVPSGITNGTYTIVSRAYINSTAFDDSAPITVTVQN